MTDLRTLSFGAALFAVGDILTNTNYANNYYASLTYKNFAKELPLLNNTTSKFCPFKTMQKKMGNRAPSLLETKWRTFRNLKIRELARNFFFSFIVQKAMFQWVPSYLDKLIFSHSVRSPQMLKVTAVAIRACAQTMLTSAVETRSLTQAASQSAWLQDALPRYIKSFGLGVVAETKHNILGPSILILTSQSDAKLALGQC